MVCSYDFWLCSVPENHFLLHPSVLENRFLLHPSVPENHFLLHPSVPENHFPILYFEPNPKFHWNSDLMQVQGMGDTLPSVFSINKKRFAIFRQSSNFAVGQIRTRIAESADQWLTHYTIWAVDEDVPYLGLFVSSISSYIYIKRHSR